MVDFRAKDQAHAPATGDPGANEDTLWSAWRERGDADARQQLVLQHRDFARILAGKMFAQRVTDEVEFADYLQLASVALIECVDRYDPAQGASFRTYAGHRLIGAILNGLSSLSERGRQVAARRQRERERLDSLRAGGDQCRPETPLGDLDRLAEIATGLALGFLLEQTSADHEPEGAYTDNAHERTLTRQLRERIAARVNELPEREALIIRHHYLQGIAFDEIAQRLGLTKGRVSQLHRQALTKLRQSLGTTDALHLSL